MTFTVEPMINVGHWKSDVLDDGWTAVTVDGSLSAQFEHTVLVTESGVDVLTLGGSETPAALGGGIALAKQARSTQSAHGARARAEAPPSPNQAVLAIACLLALLSAVFALHLWGQLTVADSGGPVTCRFDCEGDCADVWRSGFALSVERATGLPVAAHGVLWSLVAFVLPAGVIVARLRAVRGDLLWAAALVTAVTGVLVVIALAAAQLVDGRFCGSCGIAYALTLAYAAVCSSRRRASRGASSVAAAPSPARRRCSASRASRSPRRSARARRPPPIRTPATRTPRSRTAARPRRRPRRRSGGPRALPPESLAGLGAGARARSRGVPRAAARARCSRRAR